MEQHDKAERCCIRDERRGTGGSRRSSAEQQSVRSHSVIFRGLSLTHVFRSRTLLRFRYCRLDDGREIVEASACCWWVRFQFQSNHSTIVVSN
jgi:hypothetical protein